MSETYKARTCGKKLPLLAFEIRRATPEEENEHHQSWMACCPKCHNDVAVFGTVGTIHNLAAHDCQYAGEPFSVVRDEDDVLVD